MRGHGEEAHGAKAECELHRGETHQSPIRATAPLVGEPSERPLELDK